MGVRYSFDSSIRRAKRYGRARAMTKDSSMELRLKKRRKSLPI